MRPHGLYSPWNSPGQNTGVGSRSLLQQTFLTQELNQGLWCCRQILYRLSYLAPETSVTQESLNTFAGTAGREPCQPWGPRRLPGSPGLSASEYTWGKAPSRSSRGAAPWTAPRVGVGSAGAEGWKPESEYRRDPWRPRKARLGVSGSLRGTGGTADTTGHQPGAEALVQAREGSLSPQRTPQSLGRRGWQVQQDRPLGGAGMGAARAPARGEIRAGEGAPPLAAATEGVQLGRSPGSRGHGQS